MVKSLSLYVLAALVLGLGAGAAIEAGGDPAWRGAAEIVEAFGALWLNALRMTVIPLVFSLLVTGIASVANAAATGKLAARAIVLFAILLVLAACYSIAATSGLLALWPVDRASAAAILAGASSPAATAVQAPDFATWLQALVPANPIRAAVEDAVLPLVVFAVFFGFAATRLPPAPRDLIASVFRAIGEIMIVIVHWVLLAGPLGVFALSLGVGARAGLGAAGALFHYVAIASLVTFGITLIAYLLAITAGRTPAGKFTAAAAPVWAIAFSTQSSIASLPAMLEAARVGLGISARVTDLVLPLAVAVFRITSPVTNLAVALFIAAVYGIELGPLQIGAGIVAAFAVSIAAVGLPGQVSFFASMAPICLAMGLPVELLGLLLAVEVIPDIFRTVGNVTGDLLATTLLKERTIKSPLTPS